MINSDKLEISVIISAMATSQEIVVPFWMEFRKEKKNLVG
jgi:hypothetical protein